MKRWPRRRRQSCENDNLPELVRRAKPVALRAAEGEAMSEIEHAAALAQAIEGLEDVCLGPTDIEVVVKALCILAAILAAVVT